MGREGADLKMTYEAAILEMRKGTYPPDANGTIRFTYGPVLGYQPRDAVLYLPQTTVKGVIEKDTGVFPFKVPAKIKDLWNARDFGPYADARLKDVPACFLNTTNVTGGNSGSPTFNAKGEQIGIIFDMTYESVIGDYYILPELQRSISVDVRYILWVTDKFSGATAHHPGDGAGRKMKRRPLALAALTLFVLGASCRPAAKGGGAAAGPKTELTRTELLDKIKGGWAGQVIGCTFGGPTEFRYPGAMIQDYQTIHWDDTLVARRFESSPGLYDDVYMDLTFVEVMAREGIDAPAVQHAQAFAHAGYPLWHANQAARYNVLNGLLPPDSGHWTNSPHADDIDFQIEADFAGLMSPGMVNAGAAICDRVGHIMNYGDGWYGGVYIAAMYSLAFVSADVESVVVGALKVLPPQSGFARCIADVVASYRADPDDWKKAWFAVERRWAEDVGCPDFVFQPGNIDARVNGAYVVIGLLYGRRRFRPDARDRDPVRPGLRLQPGQRRRDPGDDAGLRGDPGRLAGPGQGHRGPALSLHVHVARQGLRDGPRPGPGNGPRERRLGRGGGRPPAGRGDTGRAARDGLSGLPSRRAQAAGPEARDLGRDRIRGHGVRPDRRAVQDVRRPVGSLRL